MIWTGSETKWSSIHIMMHITDRGNSRWRSACIAGGAREGYFFCLFLLPWSWCAFSCGRRSRRWQAGAGSVWNGWMPISATAGIFSGMWSYEEVNFSCSWPCVGWRECEKPYIICQWTGWHLAWNFPHVFSKDLRLERSATGSSSLAPTVDRLRHALCLFVLAFHSA